MTKHRTTPAETDPPAAPVDPDVVQVIDRTATIENLMNQIIINYCNPRREAWELMWSVVLDASVMSLGAKLKVVSVIAQAVSLRLKKDSLHKVLELRNAFAHHSSNAHPVFIAGGTESDAYLELWIVRNSGDIQKMKRDDALSEYYANYRIAVQSLSELNNAVKASAGGA